MTVFCFWDLCDRELGLQIKVIIIRCVLSMLIVSYASHELSVVNGGLSVQTDGTDTHFRLASSEGHEDDNLILRVFIETAAVEEVFDEVIGCLFTDCLRTLGSVPEC